MATVRQSIEINVPVRTLYNQLTQFEVYPEFMDDVKAVQQIDDTHMHWTTMMANRPVEWDAEITEQEPDRCIAWHNTSGPANGGRIDVQAVGADASCVTFTLQSLPAQVPGSMAGESEEEMAQRLKFDLVRLKEFIEGRGDATGAWRGEIHDAAVTLRDRDARAQAASSSGNAPASGYAAGSEGFAGDEEPDAPVVSSARGAAQQRNDPAASAGPNPGKPKGERS